MIRLDFEAFNQLLSLKAITSKRTNPDLKWLGDRILLRPLEARAVTQSGIALTEMMQKQEERVNNVAEILAVGDEVDKRVKVGQIVLLLQYSGIRVSVPELRDVHLRVGSSADIYCVLKEAPKRGKSLANKKSPELG